MKTEDKRIVKVVRRFDAQPQRVFDAWLNPSSARKWLFATDDGEIVRCDIEPRVGGTYNITRRGPSPEPPNEVIDMVHVGEYLEIERPRRLVFTFAVPQFSPETTTVSIDIEPDGDGCKLSLTNDGVPEDWDERTEKGWEMILDNLAKELRSPK